VCSRNIDLVERTDNHFWEAALKNKLPEKLEDLGRNIAIQGEICGSSIQKNLEGFPDGYHDLYLFSIWEVDEQRHLPPREAEEMVKRLHLKHVPVHGYFKLKEIGINVAGLLQRAEGKGLNGKRREGIVLKHDGGKLSFKAISNTYLLKHGE
jgi:RNA ligase (TIGR02306 family)